MQKEPLVSWWSARLFFTSNSGNFHSNEKNKISESKLESRLSKTKK